MCLHSIPNPPIRQISLIGIPKPRTKTNRRTPASCSVRQFICYISFFDMTSRSSKTKRNPNPSPTGTRFGFLLFGTGNRGRWTCRGYVLAVVFPKERLRVLSCVCLALSRRPTKKDNLWLSFSVGTGNRGRTCTVTHRILNPARLPIPPYPRDITVIVYHKSGEMSIIIYPDFVWIRGMSDPRRQRQPRLS